MLFSIACLIACRLIRNHFAVPVREVAMLTSSSCFGARIGCVVRGVVCGAALCAARRVLAWRAGLGAAVLCCPPLALFGFALVVRPACCGRPLCVPLGAALGGGGLGAPPLQTVWGRGFPCASHLCGVGLRTEVGGGDADIENVPALTGRGSGCIVAAPARSTYRIVWWQFVREDIPSLPIRESVTSRLLRSSVQAKHTCPSRRTRLPRILCGRRRG